jgi:outer membrane protein assembly factor BamB
MVRLFGIRLCMGIGIRLRIGIGIRIGVGIGIGVVAAWVAPLAAQDAYWPQWRGPAGTGSSATAQPPMEWSEKKNVRWKVKLEGAGHGTPVVFGDRVFLTAAVPFGAVGDPVPDDAPGAHDNAPVTRKQEFVAFAYSRKDGKLLWRTSLRKGLPHAGAHKSGTLASASPVADARHVFAFFGSGGLFCLDHGGKLIWKTDLGKMSVKHGHGEGSSPVGHGETLAVNWDHEGKSFVAAFDKRTGAERWRADRDEVTSWATPIVIVHDGRAQLIVSGTKRVRSYDLETGKVIWECGGLAHNIVTSPVASDGMVFLSSSYEKRAMFAVKLEGAKGDITKTDRVVWRRQRRTPYVPSPLLYGKWLYFLNHYQGVLTRVDAKTGKEPNGPFRLHNMFEIYASPVGAANRIYFSDRDGSTIVISHGDDTPKVLAFNQLNDSFSASAALAGRELYLRGTKSLYCLAAPPKR